MTLRFSVGDRNVGRRFKQNIEGEYDIMVAASRSAMERARDEIKTKGDQDIKRAGNFGARWLRSLTARVLPARGKTLNLVLNVNHSIPYAWVHEFGAVIRGKPLLWIPLPWTGIKQRARDYARKVGGLFRVDREGKNPLLLSVDKGEPLYVGVEKVRLRQRFHLRQITRDVANKIPSYYAAAYRKLRRPTRRR